MHNNVIEINKEMLSFIDKSPNAYYAVGNLMIMLENAGYVRLFEGAKWKLSHGGKYYVTRDDSSIIAFRIPQMSNADDVADESESYVDQDYTGFMIMASHSDSPAFKIKPDAEITVEKSYVKLNTEKYGGMIMSTWLDRPLSVAGRIVVETPNGIETKLVNIDRDLCMIPSLAIHMDRKINDGYSWNAQKDMLPLFAGFIDCDAQTEDGRDDNTGNACCSNLTTDNIERKDTGLSGIIAKEAGVDVSDILDTDLFLYNRNKGVIFGANGEFVGSGRLDDLQCAFATMKGFVDSEDKTTDKEGNFDDSSVDDNGETAGISSIPVCCIFNNEEVGSSTKQGAASSFLEDVLARINYAFDKNAEEIRRIFTNSFMVSADNAHALHPNHVDKADPTNRPKLNEGIVIKYNANQKYTTDAVSGGLFRRICKMADVPIQTYVNRSDIAGGSTLGNIATTRVSMNSVDIGLPQLAMHSAYETAGVNDTFYLVKATKQFYSVSVKCERDGKYVVL